MITALLEWIEDTTDDAKYVSRVILILLVGALILAAGFVVLGWHFFLVLLALGLHGLFKWVRWTIRP